MKPVTVEWDVHNERHFRQRRRCSVDEVNDVLKERCAPTRAYDMPPRDGQPRRHFQGQTCRDRPIIIVTQPKLERVVRPITCIHVGERALDNYRAWRATVKR